MSRRGRRRSKRLRRVSGSAAESETARPTERSSRCRNGGAWVSRLRPNPTPSDFALGKVNKPSSKKQRRVALDRLTLELSRLHLPLDQPRFEARYYQTDRLTKAMKDLALAGNESHAANTFTKETVAEDTIT